MIRVENLVKSFGERLALNGISFEVRRGEVLGFLGPNGAGKTTTMKILVGLIPATSGRASVAGFDVSASSLEVRRRIGYLPEHPPVYRDMIVRDFLGFAADIRGVPHRRKAALVDQAVRLCGLSDVGGRLVGRLSKGYRQRVGLAQAILHEPEVLILDEPTVGLDPSQIVEIRSLIKGFGGERTVILSTHILPEVTMTCERVVIISKGAIVAEDSIRNLTLVTDRRAAVSVTVARDGDGVAGTLSGVPGVLDVRRDPAASATYLVGYAKGDDVRERLAAASVGAGHGIVELKPVAASLEDIFLDLVTQEKGLVA